MMPKIHVTPLSIRLYLESKRKRTPRTVRDSVDNPLYLGLRLDLGKPKTLCDDVELRFA
jgi:hypothetical protein